MKRILFIILMLIPIFGVKAGEWKEVEEIPIISGNTLGIKEEKEYQWYQIRKEGGYFKTSPSRDFVKTDLFTNYWSGWSSEYPENKDMVETRTVYSYKEMKKIKYVQLSDMNSDKLTFPVISLYKEDEPISYNRIEQDGMIILELDEPCYYDELEIEMTLVNVENMENTFTIEWLYDLELPSCMKTHVRQWFQISTQLTFIYRKMMPNQFLYEEEQVSLEKVEANKHTLVEKKEEYRFCEYLYYYEKEIKEYYPFYSSVPVDDYIYPDWSTERTRLFVRETKEEILPEVIEKEIIKEVPIEIIKEISVENLIVQKTLDEINILNEKLLQVVTNLEQENGGLKEEIENLKSKIIPCEKEETPKLEIQKQSLEAIYYVACFILGYLLGRIVTMKKKL